MLNALRQRLTDPDIGRQLHTLAAGAPASAPLSLTLELGRHAAPDWLAALPAGAKISASRASSSGRIISAARASSAR